MLAVIIIIYYLAVLAILLTIKPRKRLTGQYSQYRLPDAVVTDDMRQELITRFKFPAGFVPLCGWGYIWQYQDFNPDIEVVISYPGVKHTIKFWNHDRKLLYRAVKQICADFKPKARKALYA